MRRHVWLLLLLAAVSVFGVGGALVLSLRAAGSSGLRYEQEWVRALLQAGLIAVLGIVTSGVLERFKDALQQRRDDSRLRFGVLTELSRAYMDVKLVRRKIQASGAFATAEMDALNQIQVVVELHKRNSVRLFRNAGELLGYLDTMERYLNKAANKPDSPERGGFASGGFHAFADTYGAAAALIQSEIGSK